MIMATAVTLFNLNLAPLFDAIAKVESDNGMVSNNVYQLSDTFIMDVNDICGKQVFLYTDKYDRERSEQMMKVYWSYYGRRYKNKTGNEPTYSVLARIHNGGPDGWSKYATKRYWRRVKELLPEGSE